MVVVRIGQSFRQLARAMIEHVGERRHAIAGDAAAIDARLLEAAAREVADRLGTIVVTLRSHELRQFGCEVLGHADRHAFHRPVVRLVR